MINHLDLSIATPSPLGTLTQRLSLTLQTGDVQTHSFFSNRGDIWEALAVAIREEVETLVTEAPPSQRVGDEVI